MNYPSESFKERFSLKTDAKTDKKQIYKRDNIRFSVLTSRLLRVEFSQDMNFCDEPTQTVLFRNIDNPEFKVEERGYHVIIETRDAQFDYDFKVRQMQSIKLKDGRCVTDFRDGNLKGTYRTLDMVNGECRLNDGLISRSGVAVLDDSETDLINDDGTIAERRTCEDRYYFAYGYDYRACIKDFYKISGEVPLVPRYSLGNWWSRYKAYTQKEYLNLMDEFIEREIPITVATVDMDWHWVDLKDKINGNLINNLTPLFFSEGWTGYSWNTNLFPNYKDFLKILHEKGLKVTLNLHPAQGVRFFEDMYPQMAKRMGIDPATCETVNFDIADPKFIENYFDVLHRPYENDGVDFWWIDWQQEKTTKIKGLDPLWALNHYHTLAFNDTNKRPLILSRYAGLGSHRYPLGFSGDAMITWESLNFQPYFTANAANAGYTWWSHDIGGHHMGERNDELYTRWVEFGEYSPIMRLHSTNDEFLGKEPWKYSYSAEKISTRCLRERHSLIPYLYSMNYRTHKEGIAICEPMYYSNPKDENAYKVQNQYYFGSEMIAAPITSPINPATNMAGTSVFLPQGEWTDIYNGNIYRGNQILTMYRGIESIPVLAKEGAIIPYSMDDRSNDWKNPKSMRIRIFLGNNVFKLYEDDGESENYKNGEYCETVLEQRVFNFDNIFIINPCKGDGSVIPQKRDYELVFENVSYANRIEVTLGKETIDPEILKKNKKTYIKIKNCDVNQKLTVKLSGFTKRKNKDKKEYITEIISKFQMKTALKKMKFTNYLKDINRPFPVRRRALKGPIDEIFALSYEDRDAGKISK